MINFTAGTLKYFRSDLPPFLGTCKTNRLRNNHEPWLFVAASKQQPPSGLKCQRVDLENLTIEGDGPFIDGKKVRIKWGGLHGGQDCSRHRSWLGEVLGGLVVLQKHSGIERYGQSRHARLR
jgi:hypothetical protein